MAGDEADRDAALLAGLAARRPELVDLARLASIAAVVEPGLLRRLRQELVPRLDAGAEADLWFSTLTHAASATGWTMRIGIATLLRAELGKPENRALEDTARDIVREEHTGLSDLLQLEDTIIWESVVGDDEAVEQAYHRILATLDASPDAAPDVIRWFGQAQRRLPPSTLTCAPAARLTALAALHADRVVPDAVLTADRLPDGVGSGAPATLPTTELLVTLTDDGLRFADAGELADDAAMITLPHTRPLVLEVTWGALDQPRSRVVQADPGAVVSLSEVDDEVTLRTLSGSRYRLTRVPAALRVDHALEMLQSLALAFHMRKFFGPEVTDDRQVRELLGLHDELSWARYEHVRMMGEYFTEPIRRFLDGGENPLSGSTESNVDENVTSAGDEPLMWSFPGVRDTGLNWPSFHAYLSWLIESMREYMAKTADALGPELIRNGYPIPEAVWLAVRPHASPNAMPQLGDQIGSRWEDRLPTFTYDIERSAVPDLIRVLSVPVLDAVQAAEAERPPSGATADRGPDPIGLVFLWVAPDGSKIASELQDALRNRGIYVERRTNASLVETDRPLRESDLVIVLITPECFYSERARQALDVVLQQQPSTGIIPVLWHTERRSVVERFPQLGNRQMITLGQRAAERPRIFVSYRRRDTSHAAGRLADILSKDFDLFVDVEDIAPGADFAQAVRQAVDASQVMLVLIGPDWATDRNDSGLRRVEDPNDWVAREIAVALQRNTVVVPVLIDDAQMPDRNELPPQLAELTSRQALRLHHESFAKDADRLHTAILAIAEPAREVQVDDVAEEIAALIRSSSAERDASSPSVPM